MGRAPYRFDSTIGHQRQDQIDRPTNDTNQRNSVNHGWRSWLASASSLPANATTAEKAARGRDFERALVGMFHEAGLEPRASFRPSGEEVDGSIWLDGRTYLFEAKWTAASHPASSLYQFKGKIDGKLSGSVGLFFSMSGYSTDAVEALIAGKDLNLVLFDGADVRLLADGGIGIADAIRLKLRAAAESGTPYVTLGDLLSARGTVPSVRTVFVEGRFDQLVFEYLREFRAATLPVKLVASAGPMNMAPMIDAVAQAAEKPISFVAILESDQVGSKAGREVQDLVTLVNSLGGSAQMLWIPGTLEECLGLHEPGMRPAWRLHPAQLRHRVATVDLDEQVKNNPGLASVLDAVGISVSTG